MNQEQTNITTGKQIRHLRTQLGMTQEELAGELNVTRQALSNWERDVNEPDLNMLKKICFLFGVNMEAIQGRMAEAGISNLSAYVRKMALNGYVLHVDLSDIRELVSLQRRCANNLNQVAIQANTYGGIYPEEIAQLQKDYAALWEPLSDLLKKLSAVTAL